ncbi:aromatic acid decarboxylase [Bacteroidia bacterium]|nr:aromatic acid decarboxylase [Bacteroidia bacterium]
MTGPVHNIVVAVTGASGSIYALQVVRRLLASEQTERIALIFTSTAIEVAREEGVEIPLSDPRIESLDNNDMFASPASGSASWDAMIVIPCSMGTLGRIASGISGDLVGRAADVMLKERRPLVIVPRETPLNTIHLRNMATLSECGAVIAPACPSFYSHPATVEELCATVADRVVTLLGIGEPEYRWGGK